MRAEIMRILNSPKELAGLSSDEIAQMERVVRGDPVSNFMRRYGRTFLPGTGALSGQLTYLGGIGAGVAGNPAIMLPWAAGSVAEWLVERGSGKAIDDLTAMVRAGGTMPPPVALSPARQAIIRALSAQAGGHPPLEVQIPPHRISSP